MRILHICLCSAFFHEKYAYQDNLLPKYHRKMGHDVTIIAPTYSEYKSDNGGISCSPPGYTQINDGIHLIRLKPVFSVRFNQSLHIFWGVAKTINDIKPDFIFVHGVTSLNYRFLGRYKKNHPGLSIVFDNHADYENSCHSRLSYFYSRYIIRYFVIKRIVNTTDYFYGVTPARCSFLNEMYGVPYNKIHLLPMGADDEEMHLESKGIIRKEVRNKYGIHSDDFLIVTGGKIDPLKNIHVLAEAVANTQNRHIKLLIFGTIRDDLIELFDSIIKNHHEQIISIGWIPSNEVYRFFYAADLVMFPGLHSVLWEQAVASEVPCAFSRIKGFEHVDIGGNCILMDGKSMHYYKNMIEDLYRDKERYKTLQDCAMSNDSSQFLYSRIARKVIDDATTIVE